VGQLAISLSSFWNRIQGSLFSFLEEKLDSLTEKQQQLVAILELIRIEEFLPEYFQREGRPQKDRSAIARSFVAKMIYNMDSTRAPIKIGGEFADGKVKALSPVNPRFLGLLQNLQIANFQIKYMMHSLKKLCRMKLSLTILGILQL